MHPPGRKGPEHQNVVVRPQSRGQITHQTAQPILEGWHNSILDFFALELHSHHRDRHLLGLQRYGADFPKETS